MNKKELKRKALLERFNNYLKYHKVTPSFTKLPPSSNPIKLTCKLCGIPVSKYVLNLLKSPEIPPRCRVCAGKASTSTESRRKYKETMKSRFGVDNPMKNSAIKAKAKKTSEARYGAGGSIALARDAFLKKHGVDNPFKLTSVQKKIRADFLKKTGVEFYTQLESNKDNLKTKMKELYGSSSPLKAKLLKRNKCASYDEFCNKVVNYIESQGIAPNSNQAESYFSTNGSTLIKALRHLNRDDLIGKISSSLELELLDYIKSVYAGVVIHGDRDVLSGKELDIYLPDKKLAIEFNGNYWHSEAISSDKNRHYNKYKTCRDHGIELLTIFEHEWLDKRKQLELFISRKLTKSKRLYARNTKLVFNKNRIKTFIEKNHLQGSCGFKVGVGLEYQGVLVAAITVGAHHRNSKQLVLNRVCFSETTVVGGFEKMLKALDLKQDLVSWSDNRFSPFGSLYSKAGFDLEAELKPDYFYLGPNGIIKSKQSMAKANTGCPSDITEKDWNKSFGFYRIWDCGKKRWVRKYRPT